MRAETATGDTSKYRKRNVPIIDKAEIDLAVSYVFQFTHNQDAGNPTICFQWFGLLHRNAGTS